LEKMAFCINTDFVYFKFVGYSLHVSHRRRVCNWWLINDICIIILLKLYVPSSSDPSGIAVIAMCKWKFRTSVMLMFYLLQTYYLKKAYLLRCIVVSPCRSPHLTGRAISETKKQEVAGRRSFSRVWLAFRSWRWRYRTCTGLHGGTF
jgi:hypothetical protein